MGRNCVSHAGVPQRYAFQDAFDPSTIVPLSNKRTSGTAGEGGLLPIVSGGSRLSLISHDVQARRDRCCA